MNCNVSPKRISLSSIAMLPSSDLKGFLRDLVYLQEDTWNLVEKTDLPKDIQTRIKDNIQEKQVILGKIIAMIV